MSVRLAIVLLGAVAGAAAWAFAVLLVLSSRDIADDPPPLFV